MFGWPNYAESRSTRAPTSAATVLLTVLVDPTVACWCGPPGWHEAMLRKLFYDFGVECCAHIRPVSPLQWAGSARSSGRCLSTARGRRASRGGDLARSAVPHGSQDRVAQTTQLPR